MFYCGSFFHSEVGFIPCLVLFRQVIPSTMCRTLRAAALSTHNWATGAALWIPGRRCRPAPDPERSASGLRARAFPLHPAQALSPCTRPKAFHPWIPSKGLSLASCAGVVTLHPPQSALPLDSGQGSFPCIPRRHSVLHPGTQKNGIALIPHFVCSRCPDTALVSPQQHRALMKSSATSKSSSEISPFPLLSTKALTGCNGCSRSASDTT